MTWKKKRKSLWLLVTGGQGDYRLTEVISVVVPALVAPPLLLLVQSLFSIFIVFLPEVLVLQNLVGSIHLQELLVGGGVALKHKTFIIRVWPTLARSCVRVFG